MQHSHVPALVAEDLVKTYAGGRGAPPVRALNGLTLDIGAGQVFGLLGPNGAGKSTTVKIFSTLSRQDAGRALVAGLDVAREPDLVRRRIGLVSQKSSSDPMATGRENLVLAGRIQGMSRGTARERAAELLGRFGLADAADRLAKTYSGGMARKLDVAIGLMHRPQVLFLDEPTTGLDPEARSELWAEISRLSTDEQVTVLLTTHYLEEADRLAHRLAIIDAGLPCPTPQVEVMVDGLLSRLDLGYEAHRLGIEYDGAEFHSAPGQVEHDERRRDRLRRGGWRIVVVRSGDLSGWELNRWLQKVRQHLGLSSYSTLRW